MSPVVIARLSGLVVAGLGVAACIFARRLPAQTGFGLGPAFLPFWTGIVLAALACGSVLARPRTRKSPGRLLAGSRALRSALSFSFYMRWRCSRWATLLAPRFSLSSGSCSSSRSVGPARSSSGSPARHFSSSSSVSGFAYRFPVVSWAGRRCHCGNHLGSPVRLFHRSAACQSRLLLSRCPGGNTNWGAPRHWPCRGGSNADPVLVRNERDHGHDHDGWNLLRRDVRRLDDVNPG